MKTLAVVILIIAWVIITIAMGFESSTSFCPDWGESLLEGIILEIKIISIVSMILGVLWAIHYLTN